MKNDTVIISCATLKPELEFLFESGCLSYPVRWVDSGLHIWPDKLREGIQKEIDSLPPEYTTVLLLFGFCGNSLVGIKSNQRTLFLPLVSDCISLFLGSESMRDKLGSATYFFTEGYLNFEHTIISEHSYYIKKYGEKRAKSLTKQMMKHYARLAVIDTGAYELSPVVSKVKSFADDLGVETAVVPGDLSLIEALISKKFDNGGFLKVLPGDSITFNDSLGIINTSKGRRSKTVDKKD